MKLSELVDHLNQAIPLSLQEGYDNSGLQVGNDGREINSGLLTLDVKEEVIEEAVQKECGIVISHHPLIFNGLKRIDKKTPAGRIIFRAINNGIAIYSAHTNLDVLKNGVSFRMARTLGLENLSVLQSLKNRLLKLVTFIPDEHLEKVRDAVFSAGAGITGNYDKCGFTVDGTGSFRAGEGAEPFIGEKGKMHFEKEVRFETVLFSHLRDKVIKALLDAHPYEEVAYDIIPLGNDNSGIGFGCIGYLSEALDERDFLKAVSSSLSAKGIRYSKPAGRTIRKVALCGGAGASLLNDAIAANADAYLTSDLKYHSFSDAGDQILLIDCGHYETEKYATGILYDLIIEKFPTFALRFSEINTNPINYL